MAVDHEHNERTVIGRRDPLLGEIFDRRFRIEARIAAGGFGAIYRATHIKSGHPLALKVLHANLTSDPGVVARFRREGAALTRLRDPHTITAYELGETPDGTLYIVMELLHGESLYEQFRARGPLPWQRVVAIARDVCSSLTEAHALGIIHRDLKPTNIHLEPSGSGIEVVKVLDFGIAKILQSSDIDSSELTYAGQMIGTLDYMSPEQMVGGMCGPASDIYTLGVVMYEMIAGRKPFDDANSAAAALAAVLTTTPARLSLQAVVPEEVDRVVMRCIERQHTDRFQSAAELAAALDEILASGEDAVTTVDLGHPHGLLATLKGMRGPAVPPSPEMIDLAPPETGAAPAGSAAAPPSRLTPTEKASPRSRRRTGTGQDAPPLSDAAAPDRAAAPPQRFATASQDAPPRRAGSSPPWPTPPPRKLAPADPPEATLIGPLVTPRVPASSPATDARKSGPLVMPRAPALRRPPTDGLIAPHQIPVKSLREAYPAIQRPAPSPARLQSAGFDRPESSAGIGAVFDMSHVVRRDALVRRVALAIGIAIALLVIFLFAR